MLVLGIDPGLQVCGYAVVKADGSDCRLLEGNPDWDYDYDED